MSNEEEYSLGVGTTRIKSEGKVAHPADIYTHCGCEKCEARWQFQLAAYRNSLGDGYSE